MAEHFSQDELTDRELDVLKQLVGGKANKEIGAQLGVSEETVKSHMRNILAKLGANDRTHAAMIAVRRGIIPGC
jgi:DNA-binding NarL/FixJ family response regulator